MTLPPLRPLQPRISFTVLFVVCAAVATALATYLPESFLNFWLAVTISSTKTLGFLLGLSVTSSADIMTVNGFAMRIITHCTALHYVIILATAILLYTQHSIQYRITGVVSATIVIVSANAIRLIVTGVIGSISRNAFYIVHDYLWVAAFSLLILGIWIVWTEQRLKLTRETVKRDSMILLTCSAVYAALLVAMPLYGSLMARGASVLFKTLISDPQAGILFSEERMLYQYAGGTFTANFTTDLMAVALYIGLVLSTGTDGKKAIRRGILGLVIILCISVAVISAGGALVITAGKNAAVVFLWTAHGLLLSLSLGLWWLLRKAEPT